MGGAPGPALSVTFTVAGRGTEGPSVEVTSRAKAPVSGRFDVTVRFSEPVTGFDPWDELKIDNGEPVLSASLIDGTEHTVTVAPDPDATGEITVRVPAGVAVDAAGNPNTASAIFRIALAWNPLTGFTLFDNADGGADVRALTEGGELGAQSSDQLNIRAETRSGAEIGSVRLELTGTRSSSRTENLAPYALFGDRGGQAFPAGSYTVTATPYPEGSLGGTPRRRHPPGRLPRLTNPEPPGVA